MRDQKEKQTEKEKGGESVQGQQGTTHARSERKDTQHNPSLFDEEKKRREKNFLEEKTQTKNKILERRNPPPLPGPSLNGSGGTGGVNFSKINTVQTQKRNPPPPPLEKRREWNF